MFLFQTINLRTHITQIILLLLSPLYVIRGCLMWGCDEKFSNKIRLKTRNQCFGRAYWLDLLVKSVLLISLSYLKLRICFQFFDEYFLLYGFLLCFIAAAWITIEEKNNYRPCILVKKIIITKQLSYRLGYSYL